ncbi:MAG: ankyrin repeat domain-containing protein, partial [Acidobacteriota bacterium]
MRFFVRTIIPVLLLGALALTGCVSDPTAELVSAAQQGDTEKIASMLGKDADIEFKTEDGKTPLLLAADGSHVEAVAALLEARAAVNAQDRSGRTALALAVMNRSM